MNKIWKTWDIETGELLKSLELDSSIGDPIAFSNDSQYIVLNDYDNRVRIYEFSTGKYLHTLDGFTPRCAAAISSDGKLLATGSGYGDDIRIWDMRTGRCVYVLEGHQDGVNALAFSPDSRYIVSGSSDQTIKIWNIQQDACISTLNTDQEVKGLAVSNDGKYIVSCYAYDNIVQIWAFPQPLHTLIDQTREQFKKWTLSAEDKRKYYLE